MLWYITVGPAIEEVIMAIVMLLIVLMIMGMYVSSDTKQTEKEKVQSSSEYANTFLLIILLTVFASLFPTKEEAELLAKRSTMTSIEIYQDIQEPSDADNKKETNTKTD